jgi:folate-binding protein YgfZ
VLQTDNLNLLKFFPAPFGLSAFEGPDAERYLHGRITQDVKKLAVGQAARSLVLTPQGRVLGQFSILRRGPTSFLVATDPVASAAEAEDIFRAILQFKVADQLTGKQVDGDYLRLYLIGPGAGKAAEKLSLPTAGAAINLKLGTSEATQIIYPAEASTEVNSNLERLGATGIERAEFEALSVVSGAALFGRDITEKTLAPELDVESLVSFNKGCYAGQEVVEMATARGRANRKLKHLRSKGQSQILAGAELFSPNEPGKAAGTVTSAAYNQADDCTYILAYLKSVDGLAANYLCQSIAFELVG